MYKRICPKCNQEVWHKTAKSGRRSFNKNAPCAKCKNKYNKCKNLTKQNSYSRECPYCRKTVQYTNYSSWNWANRVKSRCYDCYLANLKERLGQTKGMDYLGK